jgi:hypothetical protein
MLDPTPKLPDDTPISAVEFPARIRNVLVAGKTATHCIPRLSKKCSATEKKPEDAEHEPAFRCASVSYKFGAHGLFRCGSLAPYRG